MRLLICDSGVAHQLLDIGVLRFNSPLWKVSPNYGYPCNSVCRIGFFKKDSGVAFEIALDSPQVFRPLYLHPLPLACGCVGQPAAALLVFAHGVRL